MVVLALRLVSRGAPQVPESLRTYLARVLREAAALAASPDTLGPQTTPEAISLAVELFGSSENRDFLSAEHDFASITPELAGQFLKRMEEANARSG